MTFRSFMRENWPGFLILFVMPYVTLRLTLFVAPIVAKWPGR